MYTPARLLLSLSHRCMHVSEGVLCVGVSLCGGGTYVLTLAS